MALRNILVPLALGVGMVVIVAGASPVCVHRVSEKALINKDMSNARQILIGLSSFASDWNGKLPGGVPELGPVKTSTDAFQMLMPYYLDTESVFWYARKPGKLQPPVEDNTLHPHEVTYIYVAGQEIAGIQEPAETRSPLVADEQDSPGIYGEHHPWLKQKKAVVGYLGGNVRTETLTSSRPGATVMRKGSDMKDIFQTLSTMPAGLLRVPRENILLPGPVAKP